MTNSAILVPSERRAVARPLRARPSPLATISSAAGRAAEARPLRRFGEVLAMTAIVPLVGHVLHPDDPLFRRSAFFWPIFAPLLASLRYGAAAGSVSALVLDAVLLADWRRQGRPVGELPLSPLVATLAVTLVCGQFAEVWERALRRLRAGLEASSLQLAELSREHFLLQVSHDRLEARPGGEIASMRSALKEIRGLAAPGRGSLAQMGQPLVALFASYCRIDVAALYALQGDPVQGHRLGSEPVAVVGRPDPLDCDGDPLLEAALRNGQLVATPDLASPESAGRRTRLILAAPLIDAGGTLRGALCVQSLPFLALDEANLRTIAVLAGHAADLLAEAEGLGGHRRAQREEFAARIARATRDLEQGVPTTVLGVILRRASPLRGIVEPLVRQALRATDYALFESDEERALIAVVLPATDARGAQVLEGRLRELATQHLGALPPRLGESMVLHRVVRGDTGPGVLAGL